MKETVQQTSVWELSSRVMSQIALETELRYVKQLSQFFFAEVYTPGLECSGYTSDYHKRASRYFSVMV